MNKVIICWGLWYRGSLVFGYFWFYSYSSFLESSKGNFYVFVVFVRNCNLFYIGLECKWNYICLSRKGFEGLFKLILYLISVDVEF